MNNSASLSTFGPRRVLVRGVNWLGDAVMTTPALQRLREALPEAQLALLTHEKLASLWERHPSLDLILTFSPREGPWSVARRLRAEHYQTALVLPNSPRSALEVWLAGIPQRIGSTRPGWSWLLTRALAPRAGRGRMCRRSPRQVRRLIRRAADAASVAAHSAPDGLAHQIHDYLHLAAALGADPKPLPPKLEISAAEVQQAEEALRKDLAAGEESRLPSLRPILLGLNPGAEYGPAKRWPAERFAAVAREISRRQGHCLWLAFGGAGDWPVCEEIARRAGGGVVNLAGKTSLRQLMALLRLCRVLLTNDSGPMHVAAALGTPVVAPFGSTSAVLTGPGLPGDARHHLLQSDAPCAPCFRRRCPIDFRCMAGISVERVVEAVSRGLEAGASS